MRVDVIASGSSGNCAVIDETIVIDAGWNVSPDAEIVLLTHHHSDHTKHIDKMRGLLIYCTPDTARALEPKFPYTTFNNISSGEPFRYVNKDGVGYWIKPVELRHDAPCVGFDILRDEIDGDSSRIFFATDFNSIVREDDFIRALRDKVYDELYIECNNTLTPADFFDVYFYEEEQKPPRDEFHRRKSFQNHCNADYLLDVFTRAGYSADNRFAEPVRLMHKSSYYYLKNVTKLTELFNVINITNILY